MDEGFNSEREVLRPKMVLGQDLLKMPSIQTDKIFGPYLTGTQSNFFKAHSVNSLKAHFEERDLKTNFEEKSRGAHLEPDKGVFAKKNGLISARLKTCSSTK